MRGYKIWVGQGPDEGMFKLETEWDNAVDRLKELKHVFETAKFRNTGIIEVEIGTCKTCGRVELKEWLDDNSGECLKCEDLRFDAQRDAEEEVD